MKFEFNKTTVLKAIVIAILFAAMFLGAVELVLLVDLGGIDFAVSFLLVYFATIRDSLIFKYRALKSEVGATILFISELYVFRPKIFLSHVSASGMLVALTCSVFLACLLWVPAIYLSSGFFG